MLREPINNELEAVIEEAVTRSRQPGDKARAYAGATGVLTHEDVSTTADEDGYTIHPFALDLDALDDPHAVFIS